MSDEQATQLADTRPYLDCPLRVAIPVNVPERILPPARDMQIYTNTFSAMAISHSVTKGNDIAKLSIVEEEGALKSQKFRKLSKPMEIQGKEITKKNIINMDHDANLKNAMKDFTVLAYSSKRAGKKDVEASAYASLGVVCDNQEDFAGAIQYFEQYLQLCEELNDSMGIAAACNCIGVNYMMLANPSGESSVAFAQQISQTENPSEILDYVQKSINYHSRHVEVGPDTGGRLVAHTNLGICLTWLGDVNQAAKNHQDALRIAIKMQTLYGQSIAVGNLGLLAMGKRDFGTARTCFDQHLQLIQALSDPEAEINAWKMLGDLANAQENYGEALQHLEQARATAQKEGFLNDLRRIHCLIGIAKGTLEFTEFTQNMTDPTSYGFEN